MGRLYQLNLEEKKVSDALKKIIKKVEELKTYCEDTFINSKDFHVTARKEYKALLRMILAVRAIRGRGKRRFGDKIYTDGLPQDLATIYHVYLK